ncbi:hypothetical protein PInf_008895 [Phytophthora infestans]|nr:hypothetical protein PInf_008895 [Phytophthora infestans]
MASSALGVQFIANGAGCNIQKDPVNPVPTYAKDNAEDMYGSYTSSVMSPSQASSDDFPRLIGAENFDVWKTRVCAALDGKHLLGYVKQPDYDGVSDDESEDSGSDMANANDEPHPNGTKNVEIDSDAVDYDESDDELKPPSGSDEDSGANSDTSIKRKDLPAARSLNQREASVHANAPRKSRVSLLASANAVDKKPRPKPS